MEVLKNMKIRDLAVYKLAEAANIYRTAFEKEVSKLNLHSGQIFVLRALFEQDGQSQIELATSLNLSAPTVYKMVRNLVGKDFVVCRKCMTDGRLIRVYLANRALELQRSIETVWEDFDRAFLKSLTETERLMLSQLLDKIKDDQID